LVFLSAREVGYSLSLSLAKTASITADNFPKKPARFLILNPPFKNPKERGVIYGIKELPNVAFQHKTPSRIISAHLSYRIGEKINASMRTFAYPAGKRSRNKGRFEYRIENLENRVMQDPIPHRGLVNPSSFGVVNPKPLVKPVLVSPAPQIAAQSKDIPLKIFLELQYIRLVPFVAFKLIPRRKEIFRVDY
jgi:hypothetical protein